MEFLEERQKMVEDQIISRGIGDSVVISSFLKVPRDQFVPTEIRHLSYYDQALPIGGGQTISQPFIVALMVSSLGLGRKINRVLEVGTGSGYGAAILSQIFSEVYTVETRPDLLKAAEGRIKKLEYSNVHFIQGDGSRGYTKKSPYDGILVTAATPEIPKPLLDQLAVGGRLIIPVGPKASEGPQKLKRITKTGQVGSRFTEEDLGEVLFVPLVMAT